MPFARRLVVILALAAPLPALADTDRSDPVAVSDAFLTAFKARDLDTLATLVNRYNRTLFDAIAAEGENHPDYAEVFSGWRGEAADAWDGETLELRYDDDQAWVRFGDISADETAILVLDDEDGWAITDINSPARADCDAKPATR